MSLIARRQNQQGLTHFVGSLRTCGLPSTSLHCNQNDYSARNDSGTIVVFTALALMLLLLIVGMALEYSRIQHIKSMIVSSGQAAILTAAKLYPEQCGPDFFTSCICGRRDPFEVHDSFKKTYKLVFAENTTSNDPSVISHSDPDFNGSCTRGAANVDYDFYANGSATINTIFLSLFGYNTHMITYRVHAHRRD